MSPTGHSANPGAIVIKIGGTTLEEQSSQSGLWRSLVSLSVKHPGGVALIHGGGKAVDKHLERLGFTTERKEGIRITPVDQIGEIVSVLAGVVNKSIVGSINAIGGKAVGLCLGDGGTGGVVTTRKATHYPFDAGRVGSVKNVGHAPLLRVMLREHYIPVISSIGIDLEGQFLNVNADDAAAGVATALKASALVLLTDVPGVMGADKAVIPELTAAGIESLIHRGVIQGGMVPKVKAALAASATSGAPVVILNGNDPAALAAWIGGERVGTRILSPLK